MSNNYLDEDTNSNHEWKVNDTSATINVDHGDHVHKLDVSNVPIKDMYDNTNKSYGDAHRASDHHKK